MFHELGHVMGYGHSSAFTTDSELEVSPSAIPIAIKRTPIAPSGNSCCMLSSALHPQRNNNKRVHTPIIFFILSIIIYKLYRFSITTLSDYLYR